MKKILIKNCTIITMNPKKEIIERGSILIEKNQISKIKNQNELPTNEMGLLVIDGTSQVALPGFVNCHTHAAMTLFRGFADDLPLKEWLEDYIWPAEGRLSQEDVYWGSMLAIAEMVSSGITTFNDMYWHPSGTALAVQSSGIRAVLNGVLVGILPSAKRDFQRAISDIKKWQGKANGRIKMVFGPHAIYSCPEEYLKKILNQAKKLGVGIHIHLAETKADKNDFRKIKNLIDNKVPIVAAHCIWVNPSFLSNFTTLSVAHCPTSNLKLASGIAPVWQMIKNKITVGLGTDGAASNNRLDLWQEMKLASILAKVSTGDPTALPAYKALEMATIDGARALGLEKEIGSLEEGKKADIILVNLGTTHLQPVHNLISTLVYSANARDVTTVIVDGKILIKNRKLLTLNLKEIYKYIKEIVRKFK